MKERRDRVDRRGVCGHFLEGAVVHICTCSSIRRSVCSSILVSSALN